MCADEAAELLRRISRRDLLVGLGAGLGGIVLAACAPASSQEARRATRRPSPRPARAPASQAPEVPVVASAQTATEPIFRLRQYDPNAPPTALALTVDDGPAHTYTQQILAVLADNGVKATFSQIGIEVRQFPTLAREVVAEGHAVCNHSLTHPEPFASLDPKVLESEILGGLEAIYEVTGAMPSVFRSPGGDWSEVVFEQLARVGEAPVDWNVDTKDWTLPGSGYISSRVARAQPGDIVICHDGGGPREETVAALRVALPALKSRGISFATL